MRMGLPPMGAGGGGSIDAGPGAGGGRLCGTGNGPDLLSDPGVPNGAEAEATNVESDGAPADPAGPEDPPEAQPALKQGA
ncbi:hypothetical protein NDU88_001009 [Pleurodeles waltl]|uniref:Uncharacterized protein n=1 Tax=Pleurodeles waltl TaxID=8319 RepID=A0AAV7TGM7_PLEWA|nr:hypothetical protein NDU88_001009 [Pleurodeles waltl]